MVEVGQQLFTSKVHGWLSKLWSLFGYPKYWVPYCNRDPKGTIILTTAHMESCTGVFWPCFLQDQEQPSEQNSFPVNWAFQNKTRILTQGPEA